jgi:hypothetical protein
MLNPLLHPRLRLDKEVLLEATTLTGKPWLAVIVMTRMMNRISLLERVDMSATPPKRRTTIIKPSFLY